MGCFHSVVKKRRISPEKTTLEILASVRATIDSNPIKVDESSSIVLRYFTPYFRAHAHVVFPPIKKRETWTIGWIQACDHMKFINEYGDLGYSSWEIPALNSGKCTVVSDSDGISYPWYGNGTEIATIIGPTKDYFEMHLTMNDNFYPAVTWDIPVSEGTNAYLTYVTRDQSFITWLAAINETTQEIFILKTIRWKFYMELYIDPRRKLGERTVFINPTYQSQPEISIGPFEKNKDNVFHCQNIPVKPTYTDHIPKSALVRPSANFAQSLLWYPSSGQPIVIIPPREKYKHKNEVVLYDNTAEAIYQSCQVLYQTS